MGDGATKRDMSVHSVDRAVSILQVLARRGPTAVTDVANELGIHKSTVFRLLYTLEARGLVDQTSTRGRYQLGYGVVQLAAGASRKLDLSQVSRRICEDLAERVGESASVDIADGDSVLSLDQVIGAASVTSVNWAGKRTPMHATSSGKIFLAFMPSEQRAAYFGRPGQRFTEHTITGRRELEAELAQVRDQGYAATMEEFEIGLAAIAAPIRDINGQVVGAISISGPNFRINAETIPALAPAVIEAADEISQRNGQPKPG